MSQPSNDDPSDDDPSDDVPEMMIKICGITRAEDAQLAVKLGASAVGFVFWPDSPRFLDPYRARRIVATLPPFVSTVGVFVDQTLEEVNGIASVARLSVVQLHGRETPAFAAHVMRPVIKAVSVFDAATAWAWPERVTLMADAHDPVRRGGTGTTADWAGAARLAAQRAVILAGGLRADNVGDALAAVKPFGIDVSSGVESAPGVKDHDKLRALFDAVSMVGLEDGR
jgi:phosphoribosylanthranilate isomerase